MIKAKRFGRVLAAAVLLPCMAVTTVTAAPSTDELEQQKAEAENEVQDLQAELAELLNKVAEMEEQLIATGEKITQTQQDLEEAQAKADAHYDDMKIRIKYMYEDGSSDMWEALLTAEDFSDFLNKAEYISTVHSYDRQKLEAKRAEVEDFDVQLQAAAEAAAAEAAAREAEQARRQTAVLQRLQRLAARVHLWEAPAEAVRRHQAPQVPAEADHLHPRVAAPREDPLPEADPQGHPAEMYQSPRRS